MTKHEVCASSIVKIDKCSFYIKSCVSDNVKSAISASVILDHVFIFFVSKIFNIFNIFAFTTVISAIQKISTLNSAGYYTGLMAISVFNLLSQN